MTTFDEATKQKARFILKRLREESAARSSDDPVKQSQMAAYWLARDGLFRQLAGRVVLAVQTPNSNVKDSLNDFAIDVIQNAKTDTQREEFANWLNSREKFLNAIAARLWQFSIEQAAQSQAKPHSFKFEVFAGGGWSSNAQRYETHDQAWTAASALKSRWFAVQDFRVVPIDEPPNQSAPTRDSNIVVIRVGDKPPVTPVAPPTQPQEENVLRYSLQIRGRWGRKRTDDFLSVDLAKRVDPKAPWALAILQTMMANKVRELNVKPGAKLRIVESPMTISSDGIERFLLGSDRTLHEEVLK